MEAHAHVFVGLKPYMALSDLVRDVKNNSSNFINDHEWVSGGFNWQEGYGAFSYSHSQIVVSSSPYARAEPVMAFRTSEGSKTWTSESLPVLARPVYLERQGGFLTVITGVNQLTLLRYEEKN